MSRLVSELGADVIDDTPRKPNAIDPRKRNYIVGGIITFIAALLIGMVYFFATTNWLTDYQNMNYITYSVNTKPDEDGPYKGKITASIIRVDYDSNYPTNFLVPKKINGHIISKIEKEAFAGCSRLKKVVMQDNILSIGTEAFINCTNLEKITFSKNLDYIGNNAFVGTKYQSLWNQQDYVLANNILVYVNENKILEDNGASSLVFVANSNSSHVNDYPGSLVYSLTSFAPADPNKEDEKKVEKWMEGLFEGFNKLKFVETPEYLSSINPNTFQDCKNLEKVIVNEVTKEIGDYAFSGCTNLASVELPNGLITIGNYSFEGNESLQIDSLHEGFVNLGVGSFQNCKSITEFTLPASVSVIPDYCFSGTGLTTINYARPETIKEINSHAFSNTKFVEFTFPKNVDAISAGVLQNCSELEQVYAYDQGPSRINGRAFLSDNKLHSFKTLDTSGNVTANCVDNDTLYVPVSVKRMDKENGQQFRNTSFKHVYIPNTVTILGNSIFEDCALIEDVTFQEGSLLRTVEESAFMGCTSLKEITFPKLVKTIGIAALADCTSLETVVLPDYHDWSESDIRIITKKGTISVAYYSTIKEELFSGCTSLANIVIPDSVTKIGEHTFKDCTSLKFLSIPASVQAISNRAFEGCNNIYLAFEDKHVSKANGPYWSEGVKEYAFGIMELFENEDYVYGLNIDGESITIIDYKKEVGTSLVMPTTIDGKNVTAIKENFLKGNETLQEVTLPDHLTYLGKGAFNDCPNLSLKNENGFNYLGNTSNEYAAVLSSDETSETYLLNDNVQSIKADALNNENITLTELDGAYYLASESNEHFALVRGIISKTITEVKVNEETALIAEDAFVDNPYVKAVDIPESVTLIGRGAFFNCYSLSLYCHKDGVPASWNFAWNLSDNDVYWSTLGPANIEGNLFEACYTLENSLRLTKNNLSSRVVSIPNKVNVVSSDQVTEYNVTEIATFFVDGNSSINSIYIPSTITRVDELAFINCPNLIIYCEASAKPAGWHDNWKEESQPVYWGTTNTNNHVTLDGIDYVLNGNKAIIAGHSANLSRVSLTESITSNGNTYSVESIADKAFAGSTILSSIYIPSSITSISSTAFEGCDSLTVYFQGSATEGFKEYYSRPVYENVHKDDIYLSVPESSSDASIEYLLNRNKQEASVTSCVYGAVYVNVPESISVNNVQFAVTSINERAFQHCSTIISIEIASSVKNIGSYAFFGCSQLRSDVVIPDSVITMGEWVFGETSLNFELYIVSKTIPEGWNSDWLCYEYDSESDSDEIIEIYYYLGLGAEWEYDENNVPKVITNED